MPSQLVVSLVLASPGVNSLKQISALQTNMSSFAFVLLCSCCVQCGTLVDGEHYCLLIQYIVHHGPEKAWFSKRACYHS